MMSRLRFASSSPAHPNAGKKAFSLPATTILPVARGVFFIPVTGFLPLFLQLWIFLHLAFIAKMDTICRQTICQ
jgi:hypothetical protein